MLTCLPQVAQHHIMNLSIKVSGHYSRAEYCQEWIQYYLGGLQPKLNLIKNFA